MKIVSFIFIVCLLCLGGEIKGQDIRLLSYNIRFDNPADKPHMWKDRLPFILEQINGFEPDIMGMQEVLKNQLEDLERALVDFERLGVGRDDGKEAGEFSPIFYRRDRFERGGNGTIWLSETPALVSRGWDAALPRIATWAILTDINTKNSYLVINTHFDHVGKQARLESMKLIFNFATQGRFLDYKTIVMGDFNTSPDDEPYLWLQNQERWQDTYETAAYRSGSVGTFNGFRYEHISPRIDYIFVDPLIKVESYQVLQEWYNGIIPSDHWPVMVIVK